MIKISLNDLMKDSTWKMYSITTPTYSAIHSRGNQRLDKMQFETYINENFDDSLECSVSLEKSKDRKYDIKVYTFNNAVKLELYYPTSLNIFLHNIDLFFR